MSVITMPKPGVLTGVVVATFAVPYATDLQRIEHFQIVLADYLGDGAKETTFVTRDGSLFDEASGLIGDMVDVSWHKAVMGSGRVKVIDAVEAR
jgi:hypothetical protein